MAGSRRAIKVHVARPFAVRIMRETQYRIERPIPRRGLSRVEAAMYLGVSASKFDQMVTDGRMPGPKRIDGRKIWDVRQLDLAFDDLPVEGNSWDDV
jgi:excisionase family DNA binding protein